MQERQARADAETALRETQASLHNCQTRLGHLELALEEVRTQNGILTDAAAQIPTPAVIVHTRKRRVRDNAESSETEPSAARSKRAAAEPQPVKWWIKTTR